MRRCSAQARNGFIARNGAASQSTGGMKNTGETTEDLEKDWLRRKGGTGVTSYELWYSYLNTKGFATGTINDRQNAFFIGGTQA